MARGDRAALSSRDAVAAVWRIESPRIVGALARYTGDFALAEDLAQEALAEALVTWPRDGLPDEPAGWLLTVGRRRAIDAFRRRAGRDERYAALARDLGEGGAATGGDPGADAGDDLLFDPDRIDDDVLALMFVACHPVLSREARVALTLRVVAGLTSDEIARAFLVPTATVQARITRAKKTLGAAGVAFGVPPAAERADRLGSVLNVIYLIFTEGSSASSGDDLIRVELADEARRLARVLARLVPDHAEAHGLLALLELTAARFPARTGRDGEPVLLEDQDRRRWDVAALGRGGAALARAQELGRGLGAYGCRPRSPGATRPPRLSRPPTGSGSCCSTRRSVGSRPHRWSTSTARWRSRWPGVRRPGSRSSTGWRAHRSSPARTCCPACAVSCSSGSDGPPRRGRRWSSPSRAAATSGSGTCSGARSPDWARGDGRVRVRRRPHGRCQDRRTSVRALLSATLVSQRSRALASS